MVQAIGSVLRVVGPSQLEAADKARAEETEAAQSAIDDGVMSSIAGYVRKEFDQMKRHRSNTLSGWSDRLLNALRVFNGQYDAAKLNEIRQFGGSEITPASTP